MNKLVFIIFFFTLSLSAACQTVDFTFESSSGSFCNPSTITFKQACTGNPKSFIWSFGNNKYSSKPIDSVKYTTAGTYTVQLTAVFASTSLKITKTVVISPGVTAKIGFDKNYLCQPGVINFTGSGSGNIATYEWNFGDGTANVITTSSAISHNFGRFATFHTTLKTTSAAGCSDTTSTRIDVRSIPISVNVNNIRGCIPMVIHFTAAATAPANSTITNYTWDYGDGTPLITAPADTISHSYDIVGNFIPSVTVSTSEGCTSTYTFVNHVYFGTPPTDLVVYSPTDSICGSDSAIFIAKATNANRYYWQFGDGTNASTTDTIVKHKFSKVGTFIARVNPYFNECGASSKPVTMKVVGVIANYGYSNTCNNKNIYSFSDSSSGIPTTRQWDFGDGMLLPNTLNPVHTYPASGQFKTTLFLADALTGCTDRFIKTIYTAVPKLFSPDSIVCRKDSVQLSIADNYTDTAIRYTWSVADSLARQVANPTITVPVNSAGSLTGFVLIDHGVGSCADTLTLNNLVSVRGPNLDFTVPAITCLNTPLVATNNSRPFVAGDTIRTWSWDFGNSAAVSNLIQPDPVQYASDGSYDVRLIAIDKNGCTDTLTKSVQVNPVPFLFISVTKDSLCLGQSDTLTATHNNDLLWSPASNISCTTCDTIVVTPPASTMYYGTATNSFGCSAKDSVLVKVATSFTATISPKDIFLCRNDNASVDVFPKGKRILWSPVEGLSDPRVYNPVITGIQNTTYTATLTDSAGCVTSSSATVSVHLKSLPTVNAGPDQFLPKGSGFSITPTYSSNIISYVWSPSGSLNCNNCTSPSGVANTNELYVIKVTSDSGCVASDSILVGVDCNAKYIFMPKAFTPNNDNLNDRFYPITIAMKSVVKFAIYNREGKVMFEAHNFIPNDKNFGWDGKFKGSDQPPGAYLYTIETICLSGEKIFKNGSLVLLR